MEKLAIWAYLEAKPGKEKEVEEFLKVRAAARRKRSGNDSVVRREDRSIDVWNF